MRQSRLWPAAALAALLLTAGAARVLAVENEADVQYIAEFPNAAQRARELPLVLAQVADPAVGMDRDLVLRLTLALSQDGDQPVTGAVAMGSLVAHTTVDAISPTGGSRRAQAAALVAAAWPRKRGDAWLLTWRGLRGTPADSASEVVARLPANLAAASPDVRRSFLVDRDPWVGFGSPALTAYVLAELERPAVGYTAGYVRSHLLRRLYETDAVGGRARLLQAIQACDQTIDAPGLLLLPDAALPEFDDAFRQALKGQEKWNAICCASRYGSPALLEDIRTLYQSKAGSWACELAGAMLRYLVKHDRAAGLQAVREAMAMRDRTGCFRSLLPEVLPGFPGADVDGLLDAFVVDPVDDVAREALRAVSLLPDAPSRLQAILERCGATMPEVVRADAQSRLEQARAVHAK